MTAIVAVMEFAVIMSLAMGRWGNQANGAISGSASFC